MTPTLLKKYLKMKRLLLPLLAALAFPTAVNAKLVYLECYFPEQNWREPFNVELTLQEEQGKVTTLFKKKGYTYVSWNQWRDTS